MSDFQQTVNIYYPLGIVGELAFGSPNRSFGANVNSSGTANLFGNAYTFTSDASANPAGAATNGATVQVGGTGVFAGIMTGVKQAYLSGTTTGGPLAPSLAALDNSVQQFTTMGEIFVNLPGPANAGDIVTYDPSTGDLNSITPQTQFTASIAANGTVGGPDVMTVSAVAQGTLAVGQQITAASGRTFFIQALGTGTGNTGTYYLSTTDQGTVASAAYTAPNVPAPAFSGTATFAPNVMTVTSVVSGEVVVGMAVVGTGIPANTVVTAFGTGTGGKGIYTLNQTVGTISPAIDVTGPSEIVIANCFVERYQANTLGGTAVIKITQ